MTWWVLTLLYNSRAWTTLYTLAWTNRPAHQFMAWANYKPARRKVYKNVRGVSVHCGYRWIWDTPNITEQSESGDTYTHTFMLGALGPTEHVWYYLFSPAPDLSRQCQGPLIHIEPPEIPMLSARIFHSVAQIIPHWTPTYLTFDSELWDDGDFHGAANPTRITIPEAGLYAIGASARFLTSFAHNCSMAIQFKRTDRIAYESHTVSDTGWAGAAFNLHTIMRFVAGDWLEVQVYSSKAGDAEIVNDQLYSPHFWVARIGPYPA